jgi:SAM-dependent methyltransferase
LKIFGEDMAGSYDNWLSTPLGQYMDTREKQLIMDLLAPRPGERLLDVGCGTGNHLLFFQERGCHVTGVEPSTAMLDVARLKLEERAELKFGFAEDLPFSDNEFDVVTMITSLEFSEDPVAALREAIRVSRDRVFLGVLNKYSILGGCRRIQGRFRASIYNDARFYSIGELLSLIGSILGPVKARWGSVIFLPEAFYSFAAGVEERIPVQKNPFGAFIGLVFSVVYQYRTLQDAIREPFKLSVDARREARSAVRAIQSEAKKPEKRADDGSRLTVPEKG